MDILILIGVAILSALFTLAIHCIVIVGKESEKKWEEEKIMRKDESKELKDTNDCQKNQKKSQNNI